MIETVVLNAFNKYRDKAVAVGFLLPYEHDVIMRELEREAEDALRVQIQGHLDAHRADNTQCEDLAKLTEMFIVTTDLKGRHTVGEYIGGK